MRYSKETLIEQYDAGIKFKFLHFWGHQPHPGGIITSACFSQWWTARFIVNSITYPTTEHWMMAEKARLFADHEAEQRILESSSPGSAKKLGREVRGFRQEVWEKNRYEIVIDGNFHKFSQNRRLKEFLLSTKKRVLVEASAQDAVWGIGLDANSEFASVPTKWRGLNLLGFALMEVRDKLAEETVSD